jgi:hypothetical protein
LQQAGSFRRLSTNQHQRFDTTARQLADGAIYSILMSRLLPDQCNVHLLTRALQISVPDSNNSGFSGNSEGDAMIVARQSRMELIVENAVQWMGLGWPVQCFSTGQLALGNPRLHFWLLCTLLQCTPDAGLSSVQLESNDFPISCRSNIDEVTGEMQRLKEENDQLRNANRQLHVRNDLLASELAVSRNQLSIYKRMVDSRTRMIAKATQLISEYQQRRSKLFIDGGDQHELFNLNALDNSGRRVVFQLPVLKLNVSLAPLEDLLVTEDTYYAYNDSEDFNHYETERIEKSFLFDGHFRSISSPPDVRLDQIQGGYLQSILNNCCNGPDISASSNADYHQLMPITRSLMQE